MQHLRNELRSLAHAPWPIRLEGPTGTGKGLAARFIHEVSRRAAGPFTAQSMTHLTRDLALSRLVGHVRGAFTGAERDTRGVFEQAHGGTLFLDEIADAHPDVQGALLQLIEDRAVTRIGEERARRVDVRLVFATNADLNARVRDGRFRADLLQRLGMLTVRMLPLADHREDIPELVEHLLERLAAEAGVAAPLPTSADMKALLSYPWPGNVRELSSALKHFIALGTLPPLVLGEDQEPPWRERLDEALARHDGNRSAAARALGVSRKTLYAELSARTQQDQAHA